MPTGRIIASPKGVASAAAPDRKQRLGRYAVVWQDGPMDAFPPARLPVWPTGVTDAGPRSNR
jgi:hypothetical protein